MLLKFLAKKSRNKRDGPSKQYYKDYNDLKNNNITQTSYIHTISCDNLKDCKLSLKNIEVFIKENFKIVNTDKLENKKTKYLHYVIENGKLKFHDDLEILFKNKEIKLRSSSRVGLYDYGVNKSRIEKIINSYKKIN